MRPQWANICLVHVCIEKEKQKRNCVNDPSLEDKPVTASIWLRREQCNLNHVSRTKVFGHQYGTLTHNLLSWTLILPFRVSCSALMMSIREFSRECMLKPSNERGRSCEGRKGGWVSRKHTHNYDGISHIPQLCGSIPFIYNRVQAVELLFISKNYILLKASHKEKGSTEALDQSINPIWCSLLTWPIDHVANVCATSLMIDMTYKHKGWKTGWESTAAW